MTNYKDIKKLFEEKKIDLNSFLIDNTPLLKALQAEEARRSNVRHLEDVVRAARDGDMRSREIIRRMYANSTDKDRYAIDSIIHALDDEQILIQRTRHRIFDTSVHDSPYNTYSTFADPPVISEQDLEQMKEFIYPREETMPVIAKITSLLDYSQDYVFVYGDQKGLSTYPYSLPVGRNTDLPQKKPFKELVYKSWGKVVQGVDPAKSGGYTLLGDAWVHARSSVIVSDAANMHDMSPEYYGHSMKLVTSAESEFNGNLDDEVVVLSISHGHKTVAFVLVNRKVIDNQYQLHDVFFPAHGKFEVDLEGVQVPYPFNQNGDYNTVCQLYNTANVKMQVDLNDNYGLLMVSKTDFRNKSSNTVFFDGDESGEYDEPVLPGHLKLAVAGKNCFNAIADVLWYCKENNFLKLEGKVPNVVKVHGARNEVLVKAISGSEVEGAKKSFVPPEVKAPQGLQELPLLPRGYHWIGDAMGFVYATDPKGEELFLPYEVFDLWKMIEAVEKLEDRLLQQGQQPNDAVRQMRAQIGLVQALFKHQAQLLQGKSYNYEALAAIDFTRPDPFNKDDEDEDDPTVNYNWSSIP